MLDIAFDYDEYKFKNVKECDINIICKWMKENNNEDNMCMLDEQLLYRRFLEYYLTEDEFFVEVLKDDKLDGIIKGSINGENKNDLFLWFFVIEKENRNRGEGTRIINIFSEYMCENYSLNNIKAGVCSDNIKALNFWGSMGFKISRTTEKFFQISDTDFANLVIMNKEKAAG